MAPGRPPCRYAVNTWTADTRLSPSPQPPSAVQTPQVTEVMVILTARQGVTRQQIINIMPAEIRATVQLYLDGKIRQWDSRGDGKGVVSLIGEKSVLRNSRSTPVEVSAPWAGTNGRRFRHRGKSPSSHELCRRHLDSETFVHNPLPVLSGARRQHEIQIFAVTSRN